MKKIHIFVLFSTTRSSSVLSCEDLLHSFLHHSANIWVFIYLKSLFITWMVYLDPTYWPAPSWLVSSVGRALHRYRRGHGFKSRTGLNFFQVLFSTTRFSSVLSCEDLVHSLDFAYLPISCESLAQKDLSVIDHFLLMSNLSFLGLLHQIQAKFDLQQTQARNFQSPSKKYSILYLWLFTVIYFRFDISSFTWGDANRLYCKYPGESPAFS